MINQESSAQTNQTSNNQPAINLSSLLSQISKKDLYNRLADVYYLPPCNSKGVSRQYLQTVHNSACFRIETIELKRFLAELKPSQTKRALHANKSEAFIKLTSLLNEMNYKPLSFQAEYVPDSEWLFNVLRYIDRHNVSGMFETELISSGYNEIDSVKLLRAKKNAETLEIKSKGLQENKKFIEQITKLTELQRRIVSRKAEAELMNKTLEIIKRRIKIDEAAIENEITILALDEKLKGRSVDEASKEEFAEMKERAYM
jgi:hypothetical protein